MLTTRSRGCALALLAVLALGALSTGCSARREPAPSAVGTAASGSGDTAASGGTAASAAGDSSQVTGLAPSEKRQAIAPDFPAEIPAPMGVYSGVVSQDGSAWDYEVRVDATAISLMRWYLEAYSGRGWTSVDEGRFDDERGSGTFITLRKGGAESQVRVFGGAATRPAIAVVTVGVGAPVLETQ